MNRKQLLTAATAALMLIALTVAVFLYFRARADLAEARTAIDSCETQRESLQEEYLSCGKEVERLTTRVQQATTDAQEFERQVELREDQIADLEAGLDEAEKDRAEAIEKYERLMPSLSDMRVERAELRSKVRSYEATLKCQRPLEAISFSSNSAVSQDLQTWVSEWEGSVHDAEWDVIWNTVRDSVHHVRIPSDDGGYIMYAFVAYFGDQDWRPKSVFYVNGQCWLRTPEE